MNEIALRYGLALFSLAKENNKIAIYQNEMKILNDIFKQNDEYILLLGSSFLTLEERFDYLDQALKEVDANIVNFIKLIIKNNRTALLIEIFESFNSKCNNHFGIIEGLVYSIEPLDRDIKSEIENKIGSLENARIELHNRIDPSLIGGVRVIINGRIYDGSIKNKLEIMKESLLS